MRILYISILLLLPTFSCKYSSPAPRSEIYHNDVEIFCPIEGRRILVETTNRKEVIESIEKFIAQKQKQGTNEQYTVLRFKDKSSLIIKKISPEQLIRCSIRNIPPQAVKSYYKF